MLKKRATQDDAREREQIKLFNLIRTKERSNRYICDGKILINGQVFDIELKTSDVEKKQVSTCRNLTVERVGEFSNLWFVFSEYKKVNSQKGFVFTGEHYIAHFTHLSGWFDRQVDKLLNGSEKYIGLNNWKSAEKILRNSPEIDESTISKLKHSIEMRGLNNPKIPWLSVVVSCGIKIDHRRPQEHIREILLKEKKS